MSLFLSVAIAAAMGLGLALLSLSGQVATVFVVLLLKGRTADIRNLGVRGVSPKAVFFCFACLFCLALVAVLLPPQGRLYVAAGIAFLMAGSWLCVGISPGRNIR